MKKINKAQIIGIAIVIIGFSASYLIKGRSVSFITGVITAIGIGYIFKALPYSKQKRIE